MTAVPLSLAGMIPLPGAQTLPGTVPTPHDPAADPFLALLSRLVSPPPTEAPPEELPAEPAEESPVADEPSQQVAAEIAVAPATPALPQVPVTIQPPPPPAPAPADATDPRATPAVAATPGPLLDAPAPAPAPAPAAVSASAPSSPPASPPAPTPAPTSPVLAAVAPAIPLTHRVASTEAPAPAVARQVFPEVVRAAVTGVTPQRVVVRLEPEHLGEVRIVLRTNRSGTLEVSLAGGPEARAAIREGAPELRRMLEVAGSHDAKVVVRHLADGAAPAPAAPTAPTTTVRTDVPTTTGGLPVDVGAGTAGGTALGTSSGTPQGTPQGEDGRGQNTQDARPGATDGFPDRPLEATRPAARRAGGLDVMM